MDSRLVLLPWVALSCGTQQLPPTSCHTGPLHPAIANAPGEGAERGLRGRAERHGTARRRRSYSTALAGRGRLLGGVDAGEVTHRRRVSLARQWQWRVNCLPGRSKGREGTGGGRDGTRGGRGTAPGSRGHVLVSVSQGPSSWQVGKGCVGLRVVPVEAGARGGPLQRTGGRLGPRGVWLCGQPGSSIILFLVGPREMGRAWPEKCLLGDIIAPTCQRRFAGQGLGHGGRTHRQVTCPQQHMCTSAQRKRGVGPHCLPLDGWSHQLQRQAACGTFYIYYVHRIHSRCELAHVTSRITRNAKTCPCPAACCGVHLVAFLYI